MQERLPNTAEAFNVNILRFKNFRQRMGRAYDREAGALRQTVETLKEEGTAYFRLLEREPVTVRDFYDTSSAQRLGENALSFASMWERQLEEMPGEASLGREMAFVYLMAIFDGFVGRWRVDTGLDAEEERPEAARPGLIRDTCRELGIAVDFPEGFERTLNEVRERRNVLVHRGGIAETRYCGVTERSEVLGQRLEVSEEYLDEAERLVTELVWTLIARSPRR